jgi:UDP-glucose 4-epimerase
MKALVTGAAGFLGRHVVGALRARGHAVRALVRPAARLEDLPWAASVEIMRADLRAARDLEPAFDGIDTLVHLAAAVGGGDDAQFASTVVGTERLLGAMARTSCKRVVLVSVWTDGSVQDVTRSANGSCQAPVAPSSIRISRRLRMRPTGMSSSC